MFSRLIDGRELLLEGDGPLDRVGIGVGLQGGWSNGERDGYLKESGGSLEATRAANNPQGSRRSRWPGRASANTCKEEFVAVSRRPYVVYPRRSRGDMDLVIALHSEAAEMGCLSGS